MTCNEFVAGFANGEITEPMREHVRHCSKCSALIHALAGEEATVTPSVDAIALAAESEVVRGRKHATLRRGLAILVAIVGFLGLVLIASGERSGLSTQEAAAIAAIAVFISILVGAPLLLLFEAVASARTKGGRRFYKRLGPGRMLSGVCLGIAEATGVQVSLLRIVFVVLLFFDGVGFLLYLICDLAMPVHPGDRQYLLRFKIARAFRRLIDAVRGTRAYP